MPFLRSLLDRWHSIIPAAAATAAPTAEEREGRECATHVRPERRRTRAAARRRRRGDWGVHRRGEGERERRRGRSSVAVGRPAALSVAIASAAPPFSGAVHECTNLRPHRHRRPPLLLVYTLTHFDSTPIISKLFNEPPPRRLPKPKAEFRSDPTINKLNRLRPSNS